MQAGASGTWPNKGMEPTRMSARLMPSVRPTEMKPEFSCSGTVEYGKGGFLTSSWAWGRLESSPSQLRLSAPIFGEIVFAPDDVVGLERFVRIPILSWGVNVRHIRTAERVNDFETLTVAI